MENIFHTQSWLSSLVVYKIRANNVSDQQTKKIFKDKNKRNRDTPNKTIRTDHRHRTS